jgi:threonine synthase
MAVSSSSGGSGPQIAVPGSVANLGPGFDALAVAVQAYLRLDVTRIQPDAPGELAFTFVGGPALVGENRIERAFRRAAERYGGTVPGLAVEVRSEIPMRAGLGSSAAATVAGLRLYEAFASPRATPDLLALATEIEGHPDNAAAALVGGLALSCQFADGRVEARSWRWPDEVKLIVGTPETQLETAAARKVLPQTVSLRDAVYNLQRAQNLWRYRELLPIEGEPQTGFTRASRRSSTPAARRARRRTAAVHQGRLGEPPDVSYKDRVVSVAATRAVELGFTCSPAPRPATSPTACRRTRRGSASPATCSSPTTSSRQGARVVHLQPTVLAVRGNYDDVNRLCTQIADQYGWGFANINLRTYYAEGAKTYGFEIAEQLGWQFPRHVVSPVAGGTLLPRIARAFEELQTLGWVTATCRGCTRCRPRARAGDQRARRRLEFPEPVKPNTIAKSIAIGNPADGYHVLQAVRGTGGSGARVSDEDILEGHPVARADGGHLHRAAGGVTVAATKQLIERGASRATSRSSSASRATATRRLKCSRARACSRFTSAGRSPTSRPRSGPRPRGRS